MGTDIVTIIVGGYSFSGVSRTKFGIYRDRAQALADLRRDHFLSEDFESEIRPA
jgi:hypothetical protein